MSIYDYKGYTKQALTPGGRGKAVDVNIPGYRGQKIVERTNYTLNTARHDALNIKYGMDDRLAPEMRYFYAFGYNQLVAAKGRIAAVDPYLTIFDTDTQKYDNALTLANGGVIVKWDEGLKRWVTATPEEIEKIEMDPATGYFKNKDNGTVNVNYRPANVPIGIFSRNEYTRDLDAFNGMTPGAIETDVLIELPFFASGDKAWENPWGSAYGSLKPGDLVKADPTGRFTLSPLSDPAQLAEGTGLKAGQIELERQQVIGTVYEVRRDLTPMGAAKYAQWALSDILKFEEFNPDIWKKTHRRGEDNIDQSPWETGKGVLGYESNFTQHDLHMIMTQRENYEERMQLKYRFDFGIPGLTDGYNAVKTPKKQMVTFSKGSKGKELTFTIHDTNIESDAQFITAASLGEIDLSKPQSGTAVKEGVIVDTKFEVTYFNALQGIIKLKALEEIGADTSLFIVYTKRGQAGVPTNLDWDGCIGTVKILLQK